MSAKLIMPTSREMHFVEFFYNGGDEPFICGVDGHFTPEILVDIEKEFLQGDVSVSFPKGPGSYLFRVWREEGQYGEYMQMEIPPHWEFEEVLFEEEGKK